MTITRYTQRARAALPPLLELMGTKARWTDAELRAGLQLDHPVLQQALADLAAEGVIRRRYVPSGSAAVYSLNGPSNRDAVERPLSPVQQRTYEYLLGRRETLGSVAAASQLRWLKR